METADNRYSRAIVYRLIDIGYNKVYYGSTTQMLSKRMSDHRCKYRQWIAGKPVSHCRAFDLFDEYGIENCKIELVEEYPCKSLADLLKREGYHIQSSQCLIKSYRVELTKNIGSRTRNGISHLNKHIEKPIEKLSMQGS